MPIANGIHETDPASESQQVRSPDPRLPVLDSLRGWAILLVLAFHADGWTWFPFGRKLPADPGLAAGIIQAGHTGVTLFFVLSAFLLSRPFLAEVAGGPRVSRRRFFSRRVRRIVPAYWLAVAVATLALANTPGDLWRGVPHLLFAPAIGPELAQPLQPFSSPWWSLMTEAQFYVALPLVAWLARRSSARPLRTVLRRALVGAGLLVAWLLPVVPLVRLSVPWMLFSQLSWTGRLPAFAAGALGAWIVARYGEALRAWFARVGRVVPIGDLTVAGLLLALALLLQRVARGGPREWDQSPLLAWHAPESVLWVGVLLALLLLPLRLRGLLDNRVLRYLGTISYSMYLWHQPIFQLSLRGWRAHFGAAPMGWGPFNLLWFVCAMSIIVAVSALSYRFVEQPFLQAAIRPGGRGEGRVGPDLAGERGGGVEA